MTRDQKVALAHELREQGWMYKQIAAVMGTPLSTVAQWFVPQNEARKRRWENKHRLKCRCCNRPMKAGSARADGSPGRVVTGMCKQCISNIRAERRKAMLRLRAKGLTHDAIAMRIGAAPHTVTQEFTRMRAEGIEIPPPATGRGVPRRDRVAQKS